jgi:hypothetical protein
VLLTIAAACSAALAAAACRAWARPLRTIACCVTWERRPAATVAEPGPVAAVVCSVWDRPLSRALNLAGGSLVITIISYGNYSAGVNLLKKNLPPTSGYLRMSFWGKI